MATENVGKAVALLRALASGDADGAARDVDPGGFVLHYAGAAAGIAGLREEAARRTPGRLDVMRTLEGGPFVVAHGRDGDDVFFAIFRYANGLIAELWRFAVPVAPPNDSGHDQIDGPVAKDDDADTAAVKALVRDYYETVHIAGDHDAIGRYMAGDRQIRHEPGVRDGVAAFETDLAHLTQDRTIDEIVLLIGERDFVFILARGTHQGRPCTYLDLYRVEHDKLVEHWGFEELRRVRGRPNAMKPL